MGTSARQWIGIGTGATELLLLVQQHLQPKSSHHQRHHAQRNQKDNQLCFHILNFELQKYNFFTNRPNISFSPSKNLY